MYLYLNENWILREVPDSKHVLYHSQQTKLNFLINDTVYNILLCCDGTNNKQDIKNKLYNIYCSDKEVVDRIVNQYVEFAVNNQIILQQEMPIERVLRTFGSKNCHAPYVISIEITKKCPLRCIHCYTEAGEGTYIPYEKLENILMQAMELGVVDIQLTGGEVFEYKGIVELLLKYSKAFNSIQINTSGYLLNDKIICALKGIKNIFWRISLDGDETVHNEIRKNQYAFKKATQAIKSLSENGACVYVIMSIGTINVEYIDYVIDLSYSLGAQAFMYGYILQKGRAEKNLILSTQTILEINKQIKEKAEYYVGKGFTVANKEESVTDYISGENVHSCGLGHNQISIMADGSIFPCLSVDIPMGNIYKNTIKEIVESDICEYFRHKLPPCKDTCQDCELLAECCGCIAHAFSVSENCSYIKKFRDELKEYDQ